MRLLLTIIMMCACACIVPAPSAERVAASRPQRPAAPPFTIPLGADFGGLVTVKSVTATPGRVDPGESARITLNLDVQAELKADYQLFVHVEDAEGRLQRFNVDHWPSSGPTTQWTPGQSVRDEFLVSLPAGARTKGLHLWAGFWDPATNVRIPIVNASTVRTDGQNRLFLLMLPAE